MGTGEKLLSGGTPFQVKVAPSVVFEVPIQDTDQRMPQGREVLFRGSSSLRKGTPGLPVNLSLASS